MQWCKDLDGCFWLEFLNMPPCDRPSQEVLWLCDVSLGGLVACLVDDPLVCKSPGCCSHKTLTCPVEAFTPLHSQGRQNMDVD